MTSKMDKELFDACHELAGQLANSREANYAAQAFLANLVVPAAMQPSLAAVMKTIRESLTATSKFVAMPGNPTGGSRNHNHPMESKPCGW